MAKFLEVADMQRDNPAAWAAQMPSLVAGPPEITALVIEGGKGVAAKE